MNQTRLDTLKQMESCQPNDAFVKYAIGLEYVNMQMDGEGLNYFELLVDKFPDYLATYLHLGNLYERLGQIANCIATYKKGIEVAKKAGDNKTLGELNEALMLAEED